MIESVDKRTYKSRPLAFDWDEGNRAKCQKHGVSIEEIEALFIADQILVLLDQKHSVAEPRFHAVGRTAPGRFVFIVFTPRPSKGGNLIRPISARYMHAKEIAVYAEAVKTLPRLEK